MLITEDEQFPNKWEIVYFVTSNCTNNCRHCWSKNNFLGTMVDLNVHERFLRKVKSEKIEQIKISGGEATLYPKLPELISLIRKYIKPIVPVLIFSNGNVFFEKDGKAKSDEDIYVILHEIVGNNNNIHFHMSADEFHIMSFASKKNIEFNKAVHEYSKVIAAIICLSKLGIINFKVKLHCNKGRLDYHRKNLFSDFSECEWENFFIKTEGLVRSGNAINLNGAENIEKSNHWSAFIMMGAEFSEMLTSTTRDVYHNTNKNYYLNETKDGKGAVVLGWWNLISKNLIGGDVDDFINAINGC